MPSIYMDKHVGERTDGSMNRCVDEGADRSADGCVGEDSDECADEHAGEDSDGRLGEAPDGGVGEYGGVGGRMRLPNP